MEDDDEFCDGPFWNGTRFLSGTWPRFSPCFMSICLVWVPCGILFLVAPFYAVWLRHRHVTLRLPFSRMSAAKLTCQMSLVICTFVTLLKRNDETETSHDTASPTSTVDVLTDVIKVVSFIMLVAFGQCERKKGLPASMLQFSFWVIFSLGQTIPAYSMVELGIHKEDPLRFVLFYASLGLCLMLVFLNCWSEHPGILATRRGYMCIDEQDPCPLESASALSSLTFSWICGLLKSGYRSTIDESTMWAISQDMSSDETSGRFDAIWNDELEGRSPNEGLGGSYGMLYSREDQDNGTGSDSSSSSNTTSSSNSSINSSNYNHHHHHNNNNNNHNNNSNGESINSKTTVLENVMFSERTRLINKTEPGTSYTHLLRYTLGQDTRHRMSRPKLPCLTRCLWEMCGTDLALIVITKLIADALIVVVPLILREFLLYLKNDNSPHSEWQGLGLSVLMLVTLQSQTVLSGRCHLLAVKTGISVKTVLSTAVYKKVLSLRRGKRPDTDTEHTLTLISEDCVQMQEFFTRLGHTITTPLLVVMVIVVTYILTGPIVAIGVSSICLLVPFNLLMSLVQTDIRHTMAVFANKRVKVLQEIIRGMKIIKLFAWEVPFHSKIEAFRLMEMTSFLKLAYCHVITGIVNNMSAYLAVLLICVMCVFSVVKPTMEGPETVFMVLAYLSFLRRPLENMASFLHLSVQTFKACKRVQEFLLQEELSEDAVTVTPGAEHPVMLVGARLKWNAVTSFKLKNVTLTVPQESLVAVVGTEGCGKSSLLSAILGEMDRVRGTASRRGTVAYVPQDPWIQNGTLRDNITFGKVYRERKVKAVVSACQLEEELTSMEIDEDTLIGAQGIELDYSQEKRMALARALYHDCDLYILDEPLRGVGARVAGAVFNSVMGPKGLLKNTTRIMATNCVHILPVVDMIVVMGQGRILEVGTYEDLTSQDGALVQFLKEHFMEDRLGGAGGGGGAGRDEEDEEISNIKDAMWDRIERLTTSQCTDTSVDEDRLDKEARDRKGSFPTKFSPGTFYTNEAYSNTEYGRCENAEASGISRAPPMSLYRHYLSSIGRLSVAWCVLLLALYQSSWVLGNVWLAHWAAGDWKQPRNHSNTSSISSVEDDVDHIIAENKFYVTILVLFGIGQFLFLGCFFFLFWSAIGRTNHGLHSVIIKRLFRAPLTFFNETPLGHISNVCSRDIDTLDHHLLYNAKQLIFSWVQLLSSVVVITAIIPIFAVSIVPALIISVFLVKIYLPTSRQLFHMSVVAQTPIQTHFCDSVTGAATIRAFHAEERFLKGFSKHLDKGNAYLFGVNIAYRWVVLHLHTLANLLIFISSIFLVMFPSSGPGLAGVAIFFALQLPSLVGRLVPALSRMETDIGAVGRIQRFTEIPQEAEWENSDYRPSATWPYHGNIEFHEFSTGSSEGAWPFLKDVRLRIDAGERIGVISPSPRDRACIPWSLFRLVEGSKGTVFVDGVDISCLGLRDLRSRMTVLPQDPVLFSGSIRYNLDPLSEFKDDEIWSSLGRVYLRSFVSQLSDRLAFDVGEHGHNLSIGHRRLLSLARALLRKTNVLVVEAVAPNTLLPVTVMEDAETEHLMDNIIRMAFQACTVITVTNRPQDVINADRVLVLEDGCVKEFDCPVILLNNPASVFYTMACDAGLAA